MPALTDISDARSLAHRLPFLPGSFDLVRLANLTEAVPLHRWEHVLVEVRRVLKPAGKYNSSILSLGVQS